MPSISRYCTGLLVLIMLGHLSCASVRFQDDEARYEQQVRRLNERLIADPSDAEALRELGVIYMRTNQFAQANDYLQKAFARDNDDPKTLFYLGLASEMVGKPDTALRLYSQYPDVSRFSPYRRLLQGRHHWLTRKQLRDEMQALVAEIDAAAGSDQRIVAVYPFIYRGDDERFAPLSRGLAEMLTSDLANIGSIRVVERVRLQTLLDELKLVRNEAFDPTTTSRVGRLLGAGRIVGGQYSVPGGKNLNLDVGIFETETGTVPELETRADALRNLFQFEKALVFDLIDRMELQLSPEEREKIETVPTQNLQAFLAYSRGLSEEDDGNFGAAMRHYRQAVQLDPDFEIAAQRAEEVGNAGAVEGTAEEVIAASEGLEEPAMDLVESRMRNLNQSVGGAVVPGQDARKPAVEQESGTLGRPPAVPPRN